MSIAVGSCVVLYLASPREHAFGLVLSMGVSGIVVRGMGMSGIDEWLRGLTVTDDGVVAAFELATTFYPMHRVEKVVLDEPAGGAPAIHERFRERTGVAFGDWVGEAG